MMVKKKTVGYLIKWYLISKKHYYSLEVELIYQLNAQVNHSTFHLWLIFQVILWKFCNFVLFYYLKEIYEQSSCLVCDTICTGK